MKIALIGYGKMGRIIESRLLDKEHEVLAVVDPFYAMMGRGRPLPSDAEVYATLEDALKGDKGNSLKDVDAAIEFTLPGNAPGNILFLAREKIPVVSGTTGWFAKLGEIEKAVNSAGSSLIWSSNFSLGINLFYQIAAYAAKLMDQFAEYDVAGVETHHNKKADCPSGTAKTLVEHILAQMTRKKKAVFGNLEKEPEEDELHFASLRLGSVTGVHSLFFDSNSDTIEISHSARNREGFAAGAVMAAEWLVAKKRTGVFTVDDVLKEFLK
ncbi:MAG: 4-hydroxy-tetrahydrodipicolinate reductase [Treponema sp.]|jgi:4-hydroxy-tetrahydrodipicolinate reductase|nr:4-hydroxy-tetrahydrodipicolinate reductase [Treponema sp.]